MISYIKGTVAYIDREVVVIDNQGIGYQIKTSAKTADHIQAGIETKLYTYLYVREDTLSLFGFLTKEELSSFQTLLSVNGIGPKAAVSVLSTMTVEDLYYAVFSEDAKSIAKTPGIGPKGAKRMIIELKDKLHMEDLSGINPSDESMTPVPVESNNVSDTIEALIALGYSNGEAYRAVTQVKGGESMDSELLIKEALKNILTL